MASSQRMGLVLTGGGARASYQVGAVKALAEILAPTRSPFPVIVGSSAGAINGAVLAAQADDFTAATRNLEDIWLALSPSAVYRTDAPSLTALGWRWMGTVAGGGAKRTTANHLLDTSPLRELLGKSIDFERIVAQARRGPLRAFAVSATNYQTGTSVTFFEGNDAVEPWARSTRIGRRVLLGVEHLLASSAIPIFFPPVAIDDTFYGDGSVRLTAPLSPAIHLGADKLIALSPRYWRTDQETTELNTAPGREELSLADIAGVLLNAVFLDSVESDMERLERINRTVAMIPDERLHEVPHALRRIPALLLRPSVDLGSLATGLTTRFPRLLRYLLRGLRADGARGSDLLSYLAFERGYVERLVALGYQDTLGRADEIRAFARG